MLVEHAGQGELALSPLTVLPGEEHGIGLPVTDGDGGLGVLLGQALGFLHVGVEVIALVEVVGDVGVLDEEGVSHG